MSFDSASVYARLPPWGRDAAASLRGLQLQRRRYDRGLDAAVAAAAERETWSEERWADATGETLGTILEAARGTRHYGPSLAPGGPPSLDRLPLTPKAAVRADPDAFRSEGWGRRDLVTERTSGTSGTPLVVTSTRSATRQWYALIEARMRRWHGVSGTDRWAMFGGQVVVPVERTAPPFWVHNRPMRQLYVSTHHLSRANAPAVAEALCRFRPRYLLGYPSSMGLLARYALDDGLELPRVRVVLSNAEVLTPAQREVLEAAFAAPVRNTYGMAEAVAGASECEHGTLHLWPEVGIVEVADDDGAVRADPGASGRLVLTGLLNPAMPLLRYEVGDRGRVPVASSCPCGRTLPVLGEVEGRSTDMIVTPDGRHVFWMNPVYRDLPLAEAQIVQHTPSRVEVRVVPRPGWSDADARRLVERCHGRLGADVTVDVVTVDAIGRDPSGKFRAVVSAVRAD